MGTASYTEFNWALCKLVHLNWCSLTFQSLLVSWGLDWEKTWHVSVRAFWFLVFCVRNWSWEGHNMEITRSAWVYSKSSEFTPLLYQNSFSPRNRCLGLAVNETRNSGLNTSSQLELTTHPRLSFFLMSLPVTVILQCERKPGPQLVIVPAVMTFSFVEQGSTCIEPVILRIHCHSLQILYSPRHLAWWCFISWHHIKIVDQCWIS